MSTTKSNVIAGIIIIFALGLAIFSLKGDSITTDESPHISAGYSYLTQKDMRLNPEHPPLLKDLAAFPLLFQKINFDKEHPSWKSNVNDQWSFGPHFLYEIGNNPDAIAFWARLAILLVFVLLNVFVFKWAREKYGPKTALMALALTAFSPNILAQARYVTTDVGAAFAFVLSLYYFLKFLTQPSRKHLIWAGLAFGLAQLIKFSLFLLVPFYIGLLGTFYVVGLSVDWNNTTLRDHLRRFGIRFFRYFRALFVIFAIGYLLVWPVYQYHTWNYPAERQADDTAFLLSSSPFGSMAKLDVWMADKPILRPYAQYLLGLLMVFQRAAGGNTTYFLGDVSAEGWKSYFPTVYALKEPLPILILAAVMIMLALGRLAKTKWVWLKLAGWIRNNFTEFSWLAFIVFYWATSISGNLNIGLRHVLPTFPFIYMLIAGATQKWLRSPAKFFDQPLRWLVVAVLLTWYVAETVFTFPHYLAYFNEIAGGPANGYKYVVDSNLDWGQDLKRLTTFVEENNIPRIKLAYFGGGRPEYYLGDKYEQLDERIPNQKGWIAISATLLQGGRARAAKGFDQSTSHYNWLNQYQPKAQIGYSIFVWNIK